MLIYHHSLHNNEVVHTKMLRTLKIIWIVVIATILIAAGGVIFLAATIDQETIKTKAALMCDETGRALKINGNISWNLWSPLAIKIENILLGNGKNWSDGYLAQIKELRVKAKLLPLLHGRIEIDSLAILGLDLQLLKNKSGKNNWQDLMLVFSDQSPSVTSTEKSTSKTPKLSINNIEITKSSLSWQDQKLGKKINLSNMDLRCQIVGSNNKLVTCPHFSFNFYQGQVAGSARVNPGNQPSQLNLDLTIKNICLQKLLIDLANYQKFSSTFNLNISLNARGASGKEMFNNLSGNGKVLLNSGSYQGIDIHYEVRRVHALLNTKPLPEKSSPPATNFDQLTMSFKIDQGLLATDDFSVQALDYQATGKGSINLLANNLNLLISAYSTRDDSFFVPIKVTGTITNPTIKLDAAVILKHVLNGAVKDLKNTLQDTVSQPVTKQLQHLGRDLQKVFPINKLVHLH